MDNQSVSIFKRLRKWYLIALTAIACVLLLSHQLVQVHLDKQLNDSRIVNMAGRQRMLSQKLSKEVLSIATTPSSETQLAMGQELSHTLDVWVQSHQGLKNGDETLDLPGRNSQEVSLMFETIEPHFDSIVNAARQIVQSIPATTPAVQMRILQAKDRVLAHEGEFLKQMDEIVFHYDAEAKSKVIRLRQIEFLLLVLALITILLELIFIFRPTAIYVRKIVQNLLQAESLALSHTEEMVKLNEQLTATSEKLRVSNEELIDYSLELREKSDQLESALRFQEKIMDTSPEMIYVYDLIAKQNVFANQSLFKELGYTDDDLQKIGEHLFQQTIHPEDLEKVLHHHAQILPNLQQGEVVTLVYRMLHNGTKKFIWLEATESIFESDELGNVRTIMGITRNIHAQKLVEQKAIKANKELEQFVYSVSHDLRAPVRHIESYASLIKMEEAANLGKEGSERLDKVIYSAQRLGSMIDELLAYSRTRNAEPKKSWIDTKKLVSEILETFKQTYTQQAIFWELQDLPQCYADPGMMRQVWENLISNAIKYSSKKEETHIKIQAEERHDEIIFSIHDNGAGFNQTYADKLFKVFQRLHKKREFPGNGIGLANVARMIQHHEGRIWGESVLGEGASFYFGIPHVKHQLMGAHLDNAS